MNRTTRDFSLLAGYCSLIFWLSDQSQWLPIPDLTGLDKVEHASAYAVMALLCWRFLGNFTLQRFRPLLAVAVASLYGVSDEIHQSFVPGRSADVFDWLADSCGALLMVWLLAKHEKRNVLTHSTN